MTTWLCAHLWVALFLAFACGAGAVAAIALRLDGGPGDPAEDQRPHWMGHW